MHEIISPYRSKIFKETTHFSVNYIQQIGKAQSRKDNTEAIPSNFFNYGHEKGICRRWTIQKIALYHSIQPELRLVAFGDVATVLLNNLLSCTHK